MSIIKDIKFRFSNLLELSTKGIDQNLHKFYLFFKENEIQTIKYFKRYFLISTFLILFLLFKKNITKAIINHILKSFDGFNYIISIIFFIGFILLFIYGLVLLFRRYKFSFFQFFLLFGITILLVSLNYEYQGQVFLIYEIGFFRLSFIHLIMSISTFFLGISLINHFTFSVEENDIKTFSEDNSIMGDEDEPDLLNYSGLAENLKEKLIDQNFLSSFSVGIIGPWGNGKSSFINLLQNKIDDSNTISFHFKPYLNHTEEEISKEFFHAFQEVVKPYSGKLSNLLIEYSDKLLNLYQKKNLKGLLRREAINIGSSANLTYSKINTTLIEINRKIIIYVDDLDRLNEKEILQILKLIRNTANFRNTVFIVGLDKSYVLSRLRANNEILNNQFIDKFFQLEIYLPEIDQDILRREFKSLSKKYNVFGSEIINQELDFLIDINEILFEPYIKNLRDVKRILNQIIFEYKFVKTELLLKDFINFILLKNRYPHFITLLRRNPNRFLDISNEKYELKTKENIDPNNDNEFQFTLNMLNARNNVNLNQYQIFYDDEDKDCNNLKEFNLNCEDKNLLVLTMHTLFGSQNETKLNSIKNQGVFKRFIALTYSDSNFLIQDFENIIKSKSSDFEDIFNSLTDRGFLDDLYKSLKKYHPKNIGEFKNSVLIHLKLLKRNSESESIEYDLLRNLAVILHLSQKERSGYQIEEDGILWFKKEIFESDKYSYFLQLMILIYLHEVGEYQILNIKEEELGELAIQIFEKYLDNLGLTIWKVYDYSFFRIYSGLKNISQDIHKKVNTKFITYLNNLKTKEFEIFCAQSTDLSTIFRDNFNLTNTVVDIFGSKENYNKFIQDKNGGVSKEYLSFLNLLEISGFEIFVAFKFQKFTALLEKIRLYKEAYKTAHDISKTNFQLFLLINNNEDLRFIVNFSNSSKLSREKQDLLNMFKIYRKGDNEYLIATILNLEIRIKTLAEVFLQIFEDKYSNLSIEFIPNGGFKIFGDNKILIIETVHSSKSD